MQPVQVGLAEATLLDFQQLRRLKLLKVGPDAAIRGAHVLGQLDLPRKAGVVVPGVLEQHRIGELGANRDVLLGEDEVRDLGEAVARDRIGPDDLDVAFLENIADVARLEFHTRAL